MKNKYLLRISIAFLMMISLQSKAETYETALGLRLSGFSSGISLKHFTNPTGAVEGILSFGRHSLLVTGLYESHKPFPNAEGLSWFYGGGAHIGFINSDYGYYYFYEHRHKHDVPIDDYYATFLLGADFIIGLDYKFTGAPVNLSLDVKPFVDIIPGFYGYWEGALSVRFTF